MFDTNYKFNTMSSLAIIFLLLQMSNQVYSYSKSYPEYNYSMFKYKNQAISDDYIINQNDNYKSVSSDCTSPNALAVNIYSELDPEQPEPGKDVTLKMNYMLTENVTSGYILYKATLNGFPVVNTKDDLCDTIKDGDDPCPLITGHHTTKSTIKMPEISGSLDSTMTWFSDEDGEIFCVDMKIQL